MMNIEDYKWSIYNHKIETNGDIYGYNAFSGGFCRFTNEIKHIIKKENIEGGICTESIKQIPRSIFQEMISSSFIVNRKLDEYALVKSKHFLTRFADSNSLNLTLIPTRGCNFRCSYCFEANQNYPNDTMMPEVMNAIVDLIDTRLNNNGNLVITWFGGEPLLKINIIKQLQMQVQEIVHQKNINFYSGIITNGYLLTPKVVEDLLSVGIKFAQITIDGVKEEHDRKRHLVDGSGTFQKIINNVKNANKEFTISIRINTEKDNIKKMKGFIDYLVSINFDKLENVHPYFAVIKESSSNVEKNMCKYLSVEEFAKEETLLNQYAFSKGIQVTKRINPVIISCGSLSPQSLVVEPNGDLQKCWELVGNKATKVGNILSKGNDEENHINNQVKWYSWTRFENEKCKVCSILPLCMGGCPVNTIEKNVENTESCSPYKYNLESTLKLIAAKHKSTVM